MSPYTLGKIMAPPFLGFGHCRVWRPVYHKYAGGMLQRYRSDGERFSVPLTCSSAPWLPVGDTVLAQSTHVVLEVFLRC